MGTRRDEETEWIVDTLKKGMHGSEEDFRRSLFAIDALTSRQSAGIHAENQRHDDSMKLFNKAREAEKSGDYDLALSLYIENIKRYAIPGLSHFERPAIILEKLKRYDEALKICELALSLEVVHGPTRNAFREQFGRRKNRLLRKSKKS